jgi:hypothetical protein
MKIFDGINGLPVVWDAREENFWVCCDCGLVHLVKLRNLTNHKTKIKMYRDDYQTKKERRHEKHRNSDALERKTKKSL